MQLKIWVGPMCAGKSSALRAELNGYAGLGLRVAIIHPSCAKVNATLCRQYGGLDTRVDAYYLEDLTAFDPSDYQVVGLDEVQFLPHPEVVEQWTSVQIVLAAGLDSDYQQKPFNNTTALLNRADVITKIKAHCRGVDNQGCPTNPVETAYQALYTIRTTQATERVVIDRDCYLPVCRECLRSWVA